MTTRDAKTCCAPSPKGARQQFQSSTVPPSQNPPDHGLITLPAGSFTMGASDGPHPEDGEGPPRQVLLDGFAIAPLTVTNAQFQRFVRDTGYVSIAERAGASFVFEMLIPDAETERSKVSSAPWWCEIANASWRLPEGPKGDTIEHRLEHPVVHIALFDALAYCDWAGAQLTSEAQWEYAARGGLEAQPFPWGAELEADGHHRSNIWQGAFPQVNTAEDGHVGTAPARCFEPNGFGLYAMTGNVWEWTSDRFTALHSPRAQQNPRGPLNGNRMVAKGGSYLCHASYCYRYRTSSRQALDPRTTAGNLGFRVAKATG